MAIQNARPTKTKGVDAPKKSKFDPRDPHYQVSSKFSPDKEGTWPYPVENDSFFLTNNALRGEIKGVLACVDVIQTADSDDIGWMVELLQQMWQTHQLRMHGFHNAEEDILFPMLEKRIKLPMQPSKDDKTLMQQQGKIAMTIKDLDAGVVTPGKKELANLRWTVFSYQQKLSKYLEEKEDMLLPLMRAYFTHKELGPHKQEIAVGAPDAEMGSFIYFQGSEHFREVFMNQEGIPFFVWYLQFSSQLDTFLQTFVKPREAIVMGRKPAVVNCTC